jgi:hypothetical protein
LARDGIIFTESYIEVMRPALHGTAAYPEPSARITCILELFTIRKIAQGSQPEGDQELHRRDEDIGRAAPRRPRLRISEIPDSDFANSRTAVSVIPGQFGHG